MSEQLKPCPLCPSGGKVSVTHTHQNLYGLRQCIVWCYECELTIRRYGTNEELIAVWNTRASQPAPAQGDGLRQRVVEMWENYERFGADCTTSFEGNPMIFASRLEELYELAQALYAQREQPKCGTCNDVGMVGGLLPGDGGYQSDPCPDCAEQPQGECKCSMSIRLLGDGCQYCNPELAAELAAEAAEDAEEQPQGVVVPSDEQIAALAHRMCSNYTHRPIPDYTFERHTLIDFARAILGQHTNNTNQEPQP